MPLASHSHALRRACWMGQRTNLFGCFDFGKTDHGVGELDTLSKERFSPYSVRNCCSRMGYGSNSPTSAFVSRQERSTQQRIETKGIFDETIVSTVFIHSPATRHDDTGNGVRYRCHGTSRSEMVTSPSQEPHSQQIFSTESKKKTSNGIRPIKL
jgi:hypothetical protein